MKKINKITKFIAAAAFVGATVSSCSLDLLPLNEVVLENFWTNKEDVQSVVTSCYVGLQEEGFIKDLIIWGEVRSDNVDNGKEKDIELQDLQVGNIKTTSSFCNYDHLYKVINRCNIVMYYAPIVAEKDPNYTESDLRVNLAEVKAIRALTYLYLIKTFKNVPLVLEPSIDDTQDYNIPASSFEKIVNELIADLEPVKDWAPKKNIASGGYTAADQSTGRITRAAVYTLLAELYLWKASDAKLPVAEQQAAYTKCIECCDWVINYKREQYKAEDFDNVADIKKVIDANILSEFNIPLLAEEKGTGATSSSSSTSASQGGEASSSIFVDFNSFESIFEVTFPHNSRPTDPKNRAVPFIYGGEKDAMGGKYDGRVHGNNNLLPLKSNLTKVYDDRYLFSVTSDYRSITSFAWVDGGTFPIAKYTGSFSSGNKAMVGTSWNGSSEDYLGWWSYDSQTADWIFYRFTEVLLFRAEAEIELARLITPVANPDEEGTEGEGEGGTSASAPRTRAISEGTAIHTAEELYEDAFNLISCVYIRSNPQYWKDKGNYVPKREKFNTYATMHKLLMDERRREFLFEGKRYYDLVREARREGNTQAYVQAISDKFGGASAAVKIKMGRMDFMYLPYHKDQIKVNPNLIQNPCFDDEEEYVKN